jgi:hypothetical protein
LVELRSSYWYFSRFKTFVNIYVMTLLLHHILEFDLLVLYWR